MIYWVLHKTCFCGMKFSFCEFIKNILIPRRFWQSRVYYSVKTDPDLCVEKYRQNYLLAKRYDLAVVLQLRYWKISVNPLLSFSIFGDTVQYPVGWIVKGVEKMREISPESNKQWKNRRDNTVKTLSLLFSTQSTRGWNASICSIL